MKSMILACLAFSSVVAFADQTQDCTDAVKQISEGTLNLPVDHIVQVRTGEEGPLTYKVYTKDPKWNFEIDVDPTDRCNETGDIRPF